jgi:pimeloyl-ACP methyl ester carboxylesterase
VNTYLSKDNFLHPNSALNYGLDAIQRSILFLDVLRERGNAYIQHENSGKPPVLAFDYQIIVDGRKLGSPVNYALALILPSEDCIPTDPKKRPFVVIDPRAGHGPGIGGSKIDSEIGIALKQGYPCYFIMFFPVPEPGQTIDCVTDSERYFLKEIIARHPDSPSKPFVIGNCQGGWALMMIASLEPDLPGPILLAGSPISYWAGVKGKHPLRYLGGLSGGTWSASLAGDLGNGKFDGAHLVNNFEQLDPANTYWGKLYKLYAEVDTERERFLEFERWWGGHFLLNKAEIEWIVQNLFVGNRLSAGEILDKNNVQVNLRNIRSPIIVFASWGDNITPPQQALNWITDLYDDVQQIRDNEQTIIYVLHEKVGHLGIFVSAGVANREHTELVSALDLIDILPPGLYEAVIDDSYPDVSPFDYQAGRYIIRFEPRNIDDILQLDDGRHDEYAFHVVRRVAQINQAAYDNFVSPYIRLFSNEFTAKLWRNMNHARVERALISDENPIISSLQPLTDSVRRNRLPIAESNPWRQFEKLGSDIIIGALDSYRDMRDAMAEVTFRNIYESPLLAIAVGIRPEKLKQERTRVKTWEQREMFRLKMAEHERWFEEGTKESGFLRLIIYIASGSGVVDKRPYLAIRKIMSEFGLDSEITLAHLKEVIRRETFIVRMDEDRALQGIRQLLPEKTQREKALVLIRKLLKLGGAISEEKEARLLKASHILELNLPVTAP